MSRSNRRARQSTRQLATQDAAPAVVVVPKRDDKTLSFVRDGREYNPDAEFIEALEPKYVPFDIAAEVDHDGRPFEVQAQLFEVAADGQSYRLHKINGKAKVVEALREASNAWDKLEEADDMPYFATRLRETRYVSKAELLEAESQRLLEDYFDTDGGGGRGNDSQSWGTRNNGQNNQYGSGNDLNAPYIPMMGGPYSKQLYMNQYLDMHRKAFEAYNHNPVAHQLCELQTSFVLGRGLDHQSTNNDVGQVWGEFVERTDFYAKLEGLATDLWWQGEMMVEFYDDKPSKGLTDFRSVDPSTVWDIITEPDDLEQVYYYHQQYSTPYQTYTTTNVQVMKYIIRQIPAADLVHIKLNCSAGEKRGRSDLFSVLGWLKRLKDLMNARVIKGQLEAAFVFDIEINAGDAQVAQANMMLPDPYKPGSLWIHNKNAQMKPTVSGIRGNDAAPDISALLNMIAVGFGIPKEFIGESGKGGKSGALTATEPGTKRFERRQRMIESFCHTVANRVINNALDANQLSADDILQDARSVVALGEQQSTFEDRDDVKKDLLKKTADAQDDQDQQDQQQQQVANKLAVTGQKQQHEFNMATAGQQHRQALAGIKANTSHTITRNTNTGTSNGAAGGATNGKIKEASVTNLPTGGNKPASKGNDSSDTMSADQKTRIAAIKKSGNYSKEFLEFIFPSIAQEDRSAKLKDLALAEAMQWLPKSAAATIAAKELNVSTYSFQTAWAQIVEEAKLGMSIAHVYGQDNQHTPDTTMAQDVQAEVAAEQPVPPQSTMTNVPVPPAVAGDKLVPAAGPPGAGGSVPPGKTPNSGSTKVNKFSGPQGVDPTAKSDGYSAAANNPMANEGKANILKRESVREAIHRQLLREAIGPALDLRKKIAEIILADNEAVDELTREPALN